MEPQAYQNPQVPQAPQTPPPVQSSYKKPFNMLIIPLIVIGITMIVATVFAVMYYGKYNEQRDHNQPIIDAAVKEAEEVQKAALEDDFAEREKLPTVTYTSPSELGSVKISMPKTWSQYVEVGKNREIEFYAHPHYVPSDGVNYALRMSVTNRAYADEMKGYESAIKKGDLKSTSVQVAGVTGARLDGFLKKEQEGSIVIFPLRDKTLRVWTENVEFRGDFDNIVLKALTFVP